MRKYQQEIAAFSLVSPFWCTIILRNATQYKMALRCLYNWALAKEKITSSLKFYNVLELLIHLLVVMFLLDHWKVSTIFTLHFGKKSVRFALSWRIGFVFYFGLGFFFLNVQGVEGKKKNVALQISQFSIFIFWEKKMGISLCLVLTWGSFLSSAAVCLADSVLSSYFLVTGFLRWRGAFLLYRQSKPFWGF